MIENITSKVNPPFMNVLAKVSFSNKDKSDDIEKTAITIKAKTTALLS